MWDSESSVENKQQVQREEAIKVSFYTQGRVWLKLLECQDQRKTNIAYMWNQKKMIQMNLFTKQKQTHRLRERTYGYQRGRVGGRDRLGVWD